MRTVTQDVNEVAKLLSSRYVRTCTLVVHDHPDADALGSAAALERALTAIGKRCTLALPTPVPPKFAPLVGDDRVGRAIVPHRSADVVVVLDCSCPERTSVDLESLGKCLVVVDHHRTDGVVDFGDLRLAQPTTATAVLVHRLIAALGVPLDEFTASALLTAVHDDTAHLRTASVSADTYALCAELAATGGRALNLRRPTVSDLNALAALSDVHLEQGVAWLRVDTQWLPPDTDTWLLTDVLQWTAGALASVVFIVGEHGVHVSARTQAHVDLASVLARFHGGGHADAAGTQYSCAPAAVDGFIDRVLRGVQRAVAERLAPS